MKSSGAGARIGNAGGNDGEGNERMWIARSDLGLYAVTSPLGQSTQAARFVLLFLERALEAARDEMTPDDLRTVLDDAQFRWREIAAKEPELNGLGATLVVVVCRRSDILIASLGDCAAYHGRSGVLLNRTSGSGPPGTCSEADAYQRVLVEAFGIESKPRLATWQAMPGDRVLLTSGSGHHGAHDVVRELFACAAPDEVVRQVIHRAVEARQRDTITALAVFL